MSSPQTIVSGTVTSVELKYVGAKDTPLRTIVVETGGERPNPIPVEFFGSEMADSAISVAEGDRIVVQCYVNGRPWKDRIFLSLKARSFKMDGDDRQEDGYIEDAVPESVDAERETEVDDDNLPF